MPTSRSRPKPTVDRRQQVRAQQLQQAAAARRRRTLIQIGVVAGVAVVVLGIIATAVLVGLRSRPSSGPPTADTTVPLAGATVPFAVDGSAVRLGPSGAKARVDLWVDYSCPHCQEFEAENGQALDQLVAAGDVSVSYHNIQIVTDYGTAAGSAAACVAVEDPARWPAFNSALYANHSAETDGWSASDFRTFAEQQGVGGSALDCITAQRYTSWIGSNTSDAAAKGVSGTPTMFLNGQASPTLSGQQLVDKVNSLAGR